MKKVLLILLAFLSLSLAACSGSKDGDNPTSDGSSPTENVNATDAGTFPTENNNPTNAPETARPSEPGGSVHLPAVPGSYQYVDFFGNIESTSDIQWAVVASQNPGTVTAFSDGVRDSGDQNCSLAIMSTDITLDLGGHTLTVQQSDVNNGWGNLWLMDAVLRRNNGVLNVVSDTESGVWCCDSDGEVDNIYAGHTAILCEQIMGQPSKLLVHGNVKMTGGTWAISCNGVGSEVTVRGNVDSADSGVWARNGGQVTIDGKLTVTDARHYVALGVRGSDLGVVKGIDDYDGVTQKAGYRQYSDGESYVWVKAD